MKFPKPIKPSAHGLLDYLFAFFLAASPSIFSFVKYVDALTYTLAVAVLVLALLTDYKAGAVKVIPFQIHGIIDFSFGIFLVLCPWLFGFSKREPERMFYLVLGFTTIIIYTLSRYKTRIKIE